MFFDSYLLTDVEKRKWVVESEKFSFFRALGNCFGYIANSRKRSWIIIMADFAVIIGQAGAIMQVIGLDKPSSFVQTLYVLRNRLNKYKLVI